MSLSFGDEYQDDFDSDDAYDLPENYGDDLDQIDDWDDSDEYDEDEDDEDYYDPFYDDIRDAYGLGWPDLDDEDE